MLYRKPDWAYTEDYEEFNDAWNELAGPIREATGWKLHSFNPPYLSFVADITSTIAPQVQIPVVFARALSKALSVTVLERYEDLLFAQRAGELTPAQDNELSQLEGGLCARLPARTEFEQDLAFFAKLLRERMEKEQMREE